jgi:hypothetical protein
MLRIANISIAAAAATLLRKEKSRVVLSPGGLFALYYVSRYANPDGTPVAGFQPGYMRGQATPPLNWAIWARADLADGLDFIFIPKFTWIANQHYLVDLVGGPFALFSIGPAPP